MNALIPYRYSRSSIFHLLAFTLLLPLLCAISARCFAQCCPPTINPGGQPVSQTVNQGQPATFYVSVSSSTTPTYTWYRNGTFLASGLSSSYTIASATTNDVGTYTVAVTNASPGGVVSDGTATLTVHVKPYIVTQPASQTKLITSNVTFSVVAGGTPALTYQWRFKGTNLAGKTLSSCTLNNLTTNNAGNYAVLVGNPYGSVTSAVAVLTVTYINLAAYQPPGWSDKIVVSTVTNTTTDSSPLTTTNTLYVDFALINNGTASAGGAFTNQLYLDGVLKISPSLGGGGFLAPGFSVTIKDYSLGMLSAGDHTLMVRIDSGNQINELDESVADNEYTRTITVINPQVPLLLTPNGFVSNGFQLTVTGPPSISVVIEVSSDLSVWTPCYTNTTDPGGWFVTTDPAALGISRRFYRGRLQ